MYAYSKDGAGRSKNIKLAQEPWLGMTALLNSGPHLIIGKNGSNFILEDEAGNTIELKDFQWAPANDHNRLIAASRHPDSAFKLGNVMGDCFFGPLSYVEGHWYVRHGSSQIVLPIDVLADELEAADWLIPLSSYRVAELDDEIKWVYLNDGEVLFEDPEQSVPNHLALVMQQKGPEYTREIATSGNARPVGYMGTISHGRINVSGPLSSDPSQYQKAFDPSGSVAGGIKVMRVTDAIAAEAEARGIPVDDNYAFNQVIPGEGLRQHERPIPSTVGSEKTSATFDIELTKNGIHMRTHEAMKAAGLTATVAWPDGGQSVLPGPTAMDDMMRSVFSDTEGMVVSVSTPDNPAEVAAVIDALGGKKPDLTGVPPETIQAINAQGIQTVGSGEAVKCPSCGSHTVRAMQEDHTTAELHCLSCGNAWKRKVLQNPESKVVEGMGGGNAMTAFDIMRREVIEALGVPRISVQENDAINAAIGQAMSTMGLREMPNRALESVKWNAMKQQVVDTIGRPHELPADDPAIQDMWPDTLPWDDSEQDYYRNAAALDPNVQQQILGLTQQIQQAAQEGNTMLVQQLQQQLQTLLQQGQANGTPQTPGTPMNGFAPVMQLGSVQKEGIGGSQYSYPKMRAWERDRMRLRDDEWEKKPKGFDHPTEGWRGGPPDPLEQERFVQDKLHPDTGDVNVLGPIECPTCGESLQGINTMDGVCPYCSAPVEQAPDMPQPFARTADRSDYDHWNEDADRMWWEEEGKHPEEQPFDDPEDWARDFDDGTLDGDQIQFLEDAMTAGRAPDDIVEEAMRAHIITVDQADEALDYIANNTPTLPDEPTPYHMMGSMDKGSPYPSNSEKNSPDHSPKGQDWPEDVNNVYNACMRENPSYGKEKCAKIAWANHNKHKSSSEGKLPVGTRVEVLHQNYKGERGSITEFNGTHPDLDDEQYTILLDSGETITEVNESMFKKIKSAGVDNSALGDSTEDYFLETLTFEAANPFGGDSAPKKNSPNAPEGYKNDTPDDYHAPEPDYRWDEPEDEKVVCQLCGGNAKKLGDLGARTYYSCSDCGMEFSAAKEDDAIANDDPEDLFGWDATHVGATEVEVGKMYTLHGPNYKVPDVVKVLKVEGDKVEAAVESDQDAQFPFTVEGEGYRFSPYEQPAAVDKIEERLETNSNWKLARRTFSPSEQRGLVEENKDGQARNFEKLNLDGTHYHVANDDDKDFLWGA